MPTLHYSTASTEPAVAGMSTIHESHQQITAEIKEDEDQIQFLGYR